MTKNWRDYLTEDEKLNVLILEDDLRHEKARVTRLSKLRKVLQNRATKRAERKLTSPSNGDKVI